MKIIAVDDEKLLLDDLIPRLSKIKGVDGVTGFTSAQEALEFLQKHTADVAFLDIRMPGMSGLMLAKEMKEVVRNIKIIFLTAYSEYAVDAFKLRVSGYLLKPPTDEEIGQELDFAFRSMPVSQKKRIRIQTFGNFEVFADGLPVRFSRSKSKEILAYLIDRQGATVTKKQVAAVIWEDGEYSRSRQVQFETLVRELIESLKKVDAENIICRLHNSLSVNKDAFDCDYYRFCEWDIEAVNAYRGEYMANYSWAEFTAGYLDNKTIK